MRLLSVCTFHPQQLHGRSQERGFGTGHFGQFQTPAGRVPPRSELTSSISESSAHLCVFIMTPIHVCRCLPRVQPLAAQVLLHTVSHGGAAAGLLARFFLLREHVAVPPPPPPRRQLPLFVPSGAVLRVRHTRPVFSSPSQPEYHPPLLLYHHSDGSSRGSEVWRNTPEHVIRPHAVTSLTWKLQFARARKRARANRWISCYLCCHFFLIISMLSVYIILFDVILNRKLDSH